MPACPFGNSFKALGYDKTKKEYVNLQDVLVGDVWICSGQSNMEWQPSWGNVQITEAQYEAANDTSLRFFSVPRLSVPVEPHPHLAYIPFEDPAPTRQVVLVWRRSFTRYEAIAALRNAVYACQLDGVERLTA